FATGGDPGDRRACAIYDPGLLSSAVGMRQSLLPPSSSVALPVTRPRDRRASSKNDDRAVCQRHPARLFLTPAYASRSISNCAASDAIIASTSSRESAEK